MIKRIGWALAGALVVFGVAEAGVRIAGLVGFPLYLADSRIGYIPKPEQSGSFMNSNDWAFNELSMGTNRPFAPSEAIDVLLVGDSVVLGGNPYRQDDRLGPQLEKATGDIVWPISAGSWALQNELAYLSDHPEVVQSVDEIVFVLNGGDFGPPSSWRSEVTHPRSKPLSAVAYLVSKYLIKSEPPPTPEDLVVAPGDWRADFKAIAEKTNAPITVLLYPDRPRRDDLSPGAQLTELGADRIVTVGDDPRWSDALYRDDIHASVDGTRVLAEIIADSLQVQKGDRLFNLPPQ